MPGTYDIRDSVGRNRSQFTKRVEITKRVDCSTINGGAGLAAGETADFLELPKGFHLEDVHPAIVTPQGAASQLDIGTDAVTDGFLAAGDANGAAGSIIAVTGGESYVPGDALGETLVHIGVPAAQPALDTLVVDITFLGYIKD